MEIRLTLAEMRSRVLARAGSSNDALAYGQSEEQINEFIRSAVLHTLNQYDWPTARREEITVGWPGISGPGVGVDQRFLAYPQDSGPGSILEVAVWDDAQNRYLPLQRGQIPVQLHSDPLNVEGGTLDAQTRGRPVLYREGQNIEIWPPADKQYQLKIVFSTSPDLATDSSMSPVDSELVILWALADLLEFQGEGRLAETQRQKYQVRYGQLRHRMHARDNIRFGRIRHDPREFTPNYDARPSVL